VFLFQLLGGDFQSFFCGFQFSLRCYRKPTKSSFTEVVRSENSSERSGRTWENKPVGTEPTGVKPLSSSSLSFKNMHAPVQTRTTNKDDAEVNTLENCRSLT
jgi:hypothetical protein